MKPRRAFSIQGLKFLSADEGGSPNGSGEGYASTFDTINSYGDCIKRGAFLKCLPEFLFKGFVAFGHDWDAPAIGTITDAYEDDHGLYVKWEFHSDEESQRIRTVYQERLERGKNVGLSIGFSIAKNGFTPMDPDDPWGAWNITEVGKLFEFSVVNAEADPKASATRIQSENGEPRDGSRLSDQTDALLDDAEEIISRYARIHEMRNVGEGRHWSEDNARRLTDWHARAETLCQQFAALLKDPQAEAEAERRESERARLSLLIDLDELQGAALVGA